MSLTFVLLLMFVLYSMQIIFALICVSITLHRIDRLEDSLKDKK